MTKDDRGSQWKKIAGMSLILLILALVILLNVWLSPTTEQLPGQLDLPVYASAFQSIIIDKICA